MHRDVMKIIDTQWELPIMIIIAFDAVNGEAWKGHFESNMNGK